MTQNETMGYNNEIDLTWKDYPSLDSYPKINFFLSTIKYTALGYATFQVCFEKLLYHREVHLKIVN